MSFPAPQYTDPDLGIPSPLPPAIPIPIQSGVASQLVYSGKGILTGWSVRNEVGVAAANLTILDGTDATGRRIGIAHTGSGVSDTERAGVSGVLFQNGLFLVDSGPAYGGTLYVIPI